MKFTLNWLKDHLETTASLDQIVKTLTAIGLEVEAVTDRAKDLAPFTVGYVVSAEKHPDADRLRVCVVDTGKEKLQVVCGAPNARAGMKGVFAPVGSYIPGTKLELKKGLIRGVESNGMLVSEREMGLSDEHDGIIELPADAPLGAKFADVAGLNDPVIEIAITPNRQDCLGVRGVARDLAAAGLGTMKQLNAPAIPGTFDSRIKWRRDFPNGNGDACPYVVGRMFRNVKNGPSPRWLRDRLTAIGLRPISALVDITNYVTFDLGRPLHVFDADKVSGDLVMRFAKEGETFDALDGKTYALTGDMTAIADANGVASLAGIMGGRTTGCSESTTNVFVEVALFDPIRTAQTGRALDVTSDARYRFERGVDPESADWGAEAAARLVLEFCGGEASHNVSAGAMPDWKRTVAFRPERLVSLGGLAVDDHEAKRILQTLGFTVSPDAVAWSVDVPSWRRDVHGEADLVEEILRIHGYDRVPAVPMQLPGALPQVTVTADQRRARLVRRALAVRGLYEAVTFSFMDSKRAPLFGGGKANMKLANPISSDLDEMRPSILPNLIAAAGRNHDRGQPNANLFEVGPQYADPTPKGQSQVAAGLRAGVNGARHWDVKPRPVDAFDAKADALAALDAAGAPVASLQVTRDTPAWYHPGRSGALRLGQKALAYFGELHPAVLRAFDVKENMVGFEVLLDELPPPKARDSKARPLLKPSPFQPVQRDFAFLVDATVPADKVARAAAAADKQLIVDVSVFDLYQGAGVEPGKKSIALADTLQPVERTLTDAEI
ncbi:MAG: phenylalanine--tRNA ligase subunit beta, partial [Alphaproteobacteria bacterium]